MQTLAFFREIETIAKIFENFFQDIFDKKNLEISALMMIMTSTEHVTMNGSLTVLALYFFFYARERLNCHSKCQALY